MQVETTTGDTLSRRIGMTLRSVGYGERQMGVGAGRVTTTGNRIEYARALVGDDTAAGAIAEWYVNTPAGLEQGFTLDSAPGARRPGERLRVVLAVDGGLRAQGQPDGQALAFVDEAGRPVLRYDHLVVTDARGRELAARMDAEAGRVGLELDDRDAVYPITIDPLFTLQQKLEASDAAANDEFGSRRRSAARPSWSARWRMMAQRASIKARPMSLCAAVESGPSSRSWRPRTRPQMTCSANLWRSAGRRSWWARSR